VKSEFNHGSFRSGDWNCVNLVVRRSAGCGVESEPVVAATRICARVVSDAVVVAVANLVEPRIAWSVVLIQPLEVEVP